MGIINPRIKIIKSDLELSVVAVFLLCLGLFMTYMGRSPVLPQRGLALEKTFQLQYLPTMRLFDEFVDIPLGPIGNCVDNGWREGVCLSERILLPEISPAAKGMAQDAEDLGLREIAFETHIVESGESLWTIAQLYGIDVATLAGVNHDVENIHKIMPGQELRVMNIKGTVHKVAKGETFNEIVLKYNVDPQEIIRANDFNPEKLIVGQEIIIPGAEPLDLLKRGSALSTFIWPVREGWISSNYGMRWGRMHEGIDIAVSKGTPVYAAKEGRVQYCGWNGGYGNFIEIDHGDGLATRYAHNDSLLVKSGQWVQQGQVIARSGNTGSSTGPHLHFEIRLNNKSVNPINQLPPR